MSAQCSVLGAQEGRGQTIENGERKERTAVMAYRYTALLVILVWTLLSAGCGETSSNEEGAAAGTLFQEQEKVKGPLELRLGLEQETISLADTAALVVEMKIERAYTPRLAAEAILNNPAFIVRDAAEDRRSDTDYTYSTRRFVLEPAFSGDMAIPALTVEFTREGDETVYSLTTDPLTVHVTGLTDEERQALAIHDIAGPREMPASPLSVWWIAGAVVGVILISAGGTWALRRKHIAARKAVPPFERALQRLKELGAKPYIEQEQYEAFYYEITWIIRVFISEQFGINAPERTTEEFLADMETRPDFPAAYKPRLRDYMDHCDLVKYAAVKPSADEIQAIFNTTRDFIIAAGQGVEITSNE